MNLWSRLLDLISPRQCAVCGCRLTLTEQSICTVCYLHLPRTHYQLTPNDNPMVQLFWGLAPVSRAAALFFYKSHSEAAQLIYDLKYANRPDIGEDLGRMMAEEMQMAGFFAGRGVLMPVPLSAKRLRQRGYNQSEMICRGIREKTGWAIAAKALRRKHFKQSQTILTRQQRRDNVVDIFELHQTEGLEGKHILLVDDVCTTGATLAACANALSAIPNIRLSVLTLGFTKS